MNPPDLRALRRAARDLRLPPEAVETALDCGLLGAEQLRYEQWQTLRRMRRLMDDLGVNAPAAALLARLASEMQQMQAELARLRYVEARFFTSWDEGDWRELSGE